MAFDQISLISHADWNKNPGKRWMAIAVLQAKHRWSICKLSKVDQPSILLKSLKSRLLQPGCILSGFGFPIVIPSNYADKAGIIDFLSTLPLFGKNEWDHFFIPASSPSEINIYCPFYPSSPGNAKRLHLELSLKLLFSNLYRLCEVANDYRRSACSLFWILGGQQVGKAAISGWQEILLPALANPQINCKIWPYSGPLDDLCQEQNIVVVETYPAEFYGHLGLSFSSPTRRSKRRQSDRMAYSDLLINWARDHSLDLEASVKQAILDGFGDGLDGEDRFDALIGLYGMMNIVLGYRTFWEPDLPIIIKVEGWIVGQNQPER